MFFLLVVLKLLKHRNIKVGMISSSSSSSNISSWEISYKLCLSNVCALSRVIYNTSWRVSALSNSIVINWAAENNVAVVTNKAAVTSE